MIPEQIRAARENLDRQAEYTMQTLAQTGAVRAAVQESGQAPQLNLGGQYDEAGEYTEFFKFGDEFGSWPLGPG